ncbi:MAG: hypothetical protein AAFV72_09430 [Cyanobacteria bacterium J06635_1]
MTSDWPLLLAGPIVRRVEPKLVSVWVALRDACDVELSLWEGELTSTSDAGQLLVTNRTPFATQTEVSIRGGANLHIALVTWEGDDTKKLKDGTLYSYNVKLTPKSGGGASDLSSLNLLKTDLNSQPPVLALGYTDKKLPTFVTVPDDLLKLKIAHGSCRKTFGVGEDALAFLDTLIKDNRTSVDKRPQQLVMTGDQIYADEVAEMLLPAINAVGQDLIGKADNGLPHEHLLLPMPDDETRFWPANLEHFPAARRQRLTQVAARFTSGSAKSHLLSLGEFFAMYLMVWSNVLWPDQLTDKATLYPDEIDNPPPTHQLHTPLDKLAGAKKAYEGRKQKTEQFRKALPGVRRVLANISTYMIMDDHEVTDDWYLTDQWRHLVLQTGLGRYVIGNALIAYGVFQAWGNDPKAFKQGKNQAFLTQVQALYPATPTPPETTDTRHGSLQSLLGLVADPTDQPDNFVRWYYSVPGPKHQMIVLDTRNWRKGRSLYSPPGLIEKGVLEQQIAQTSRPEGKEVTFVVSAVPVLGLPTIEEALQPAYALKLDVMREFKRRKLDKSPPDGDTDEQTKQKLELIGAAGKDPEPWSFDPYAMENLFQRLAGHERIVFLSGDVHYALSAVADYWQKTNNALTPKARFVQLTSSAFKNIEADLLAIASSPAGQVIFDKLEAPLERLIWNEDDPAPVSAPSGKRLSAHYRARLDESPVLVGPGGWPRDTVVNRAPDRAWRFRLARDGRPDSERPEAIRHLPLAQDFDPNGDRSARVKTYNDMLVRHQATLTKNDPRLVLFDSNVGVVGLEREDSLTLTAAAIDQLAADAGLSEAVIDGLRGLQDRPILEENFRAVLKAHLGLHHGLSVQDLDTIKARTTRTDNVLAVRHQLYATHPEKRDKAEVYTQQLISLGLTSEAAPAIIGAASE